MVCKIHASKKIEDGKQLDSKTLYDYLAYNTSPTLFL